MAESALLERPAPTRASAPAAPVLTIVIPALDEEEAIGATITRCLEAVEGIKASAGVSDVEIIVVSDGSTDRTAEIARGFDGITLIEFERNRGYGAAIKAGFARGRGELVGFLDADGTCDPRVFGVMCRVALDEEAAVVLGSRLGPDSKMPAVRRLGNRFYAYLLGFLCGRWVTDTASGMRVIRRETLDQLYPLPDGLHFTPSMSARALLNGLRVAEIPMAYEERIGTSKLSVVADGVRFLRTIIEGVLCYQPERLFMIGFAGCLLALIALSGFPVENYLRHGRVEEWMIYRFLVCGLLGSVGYQLLGGAAIAHRMATFGPRRRAGDSFWAAVLSQLFEGWCLATFVSVATVAALVLLAPGIGEFLTSGTVSLHWSRVVVAAFGLLLASQALITTVLLRVLGIWKTQLVTPRGTPGVNAAFDAVADTYERELGRGLAVTGETPRYFAERRVDRLAQRLADLDVAPRRILDFGCGTGGSSALLRERLGAETVLGVDISAASLAVARRRHGGPGFAFQTRATLAEHEPADLAFCNGVLHHVPPAQRAAEVAAIHAAVRPGGLFACFENNPLNPGTRWVMRRIAFDRDAVPLRARETADLLEAAGFRTLAVDYLFLFPRCLRWLRPLETPVASLPLGAQYLVLGRRP